MSLPVFERVALRVLPLSVFLAAFCLAPSSTGVAASSSEREQRRTLRQLRVLRNFDPRRAAEKASSSLRRGDCSDLCYVVAHTTECCGNSKATRSDSHACAIAAMAAEGGGTTLLVPGCVSIGDNALAVPSMWDQAIPRSGHQNVTNLTDALGDTVNVWRIGDLKPEMNNVSVVIKGDYHASPVLPRDTKQLLQAMYYDSLEKDRMWTMASLGLEGNASFSSMALQNALADAAANASADAAAEAAAVAEAAAEALDAAEEVKRRRNQTFAKPALMGTGTDAAAEALGAVEAMERQQVATLTEPVQQALARTAPVRLRLRQS